MNTQNDHPTNNLAKAKRCGGKKVIEQKSHKGRNEEKKSLSQNLQCLAYIRKEELSDNRRSFGLHSNILYDRSNEPLV